MIKTNWSLLEIGHLVGQASRPARVLQNPLSGERNSPRRG
jgi:hypothetical protein